MTGAASPSVRLTTNILLDAASMTVPNRPLDLRSRGKLESAKKQKQSPKSQERRLDVIWAEIDQLWRGSVHAARARAGRCCSRRDDEDKTSGPTTEPARLRRRAQQGDVQEHRVRPYRGQVQAPKTKRGEPSSTLAPVPARSTMSLFSALQSRALQGYTALQGAQGQPQSAADTIVKLVERLQHAQHQEDRRSSILGLKGMARDWKEVRRGLIRTSK